MTNTQKLRSKKQLNISTYHTDRSFTYISVHQPTECNMIFNIKNWFVNNMGSLNVRTH